MTKKSSRGRRAKTVVPAAIVAVTTVGLLV